MTVDVQKWWSWPVLGRGAGMLLAVGLMGWLFATLWEVVQTHTDQAHRRSHAAAWAGHPVGTMPQSEQGSAVPAGLGAVRSEVHSAPVVWKTSGGQP